MATYQFDKYGYLSPYEGQWTTVEELRHYFVEQFPTSEKRLLLFNNYLRFIYRFQDDVFPYFEQWINGSFVSKKENPKDIDLVTFLDYRVYQSKGEKIMDRFWSFSLEDEFLDSYIVKVYPEDHALHWKYKESCAYWNRLYTQVNPNYDFSKRRKGFLKLNFEK